MFQIIAIIIIGYLGSVACQLGYLISEKEENTLFNTYKHAFSFKILYKETNLNELGIILYLLIQIILFLPANMVLDITDEELIHYLSLRDNKGIKKDLRHWKRDIEERVRKGYIKNEHSELVYWCIGIADGWIKY